MTAVVLYGKAGCCLCDEARAVLEDVRTRQPFELTEVDVSIDPVLNARYGTRIPVVEVAGEEAFELAVYGPELERLLATVTG